MMNKKISTITGSLVIIAIATSIGLVFLSSKEKGIQYKNDIVLNNSDLGNKGEVKQEEEKMVEYIQNEENEIEKKIIEDIQNEENKDSKWQKYTPGDNSFSIKYPISWKIDGSVFNDENGNKIAEFMPGIINLQPNQKCFDDLGNNDSRIKIISRKNTTINNYQTVLVVSEVLTNPGGRKWFPNTYCMYYKEGKAFIMTFYNESLTSNNENMYKKIMSTLEF